MPTPRSFSVVLLVAALAQGCRCSPTPGGADAGQDAAPSSSSQAPPLESAPVPAPPPPGSASSADPVPDPVPVAPSSLACPRGMMAVAGRFCIDKWEASLVDKVTGVGISP